MLFQAKALMQLKHPNICVHRDHFLTWNAEVKNRMYVQRLLRNIQAI